MDRGFLLTVGLSSLSVWYFLFIYLLKESTWDFSLAHPNCQHRCSRTLGPFLRKIRVVQALWCCDSLITEMASKWLMHRCWTKGCHLLAGWIRGPGDFIMLLRTAHDSNLMNDLFLKLFILSNHSWVWVTEIGESETSNEGELQYLGLYKHQCDWTLVDSEQLKQT